MSKIVFVRPLRTLEQSYGELAPAGSTEPSQGVCSLAAVARKAGYETEIVDATMEGLSNERAAEEILSRKPKYVGLSALTATI
ncbi:MAG: cobalamin B12-binding domain-containing protein, partial [Planctomycetes bacterium]|nr:cobalamin B12-binding domain-containing protein [Planctomycetota bacterium]